MIVFFLINLYFNDSIFFDFAVWGFQLHHSDKFDGVPYGLFLGPKVLLFPSLFSSNELRYTVNSKILVAQFIDFLNCYFINVGLIPLPQILFLIWINGYLVQELEEVGGLEELEKEVNRRIKISKGLL